MRLSGKSTMLALCLGTGLLGSVRAAPAGPAQSKLAAAGVDGRLHYPAYTEQGDRLPDFSHCGYAGGGVPLPVATVKLALEPVPGDADDAPRIQQAIDQVSALPLGADGLRGALL